jgi:hypothetical protein
MHWVKIYQFERNRPKALVARGLRIPVREEIIEFLATTAPVPDSLF